MNICKEVIYYDMKIVISDSLGSMFMIGFWIKIFFGYENLFFICGII